jgi:hypothetical protein
MEAERSSCWLRAKVVISSETIARRQSKRFRSLSFTQLASSTTITIASGKTLIQVVEDKNVEGGTYMRSWIGAAQAQAGVKPRNRK